MPIVAIDELCIVPQKHRDLPRRLDRMTCFLYADVLHSNHHRRMGPYTPCAGWVTTRDA